MARGMTLGRPAESGPGGPISGCPHQENGQSAAAPRRGIATHWRRLRDGREQAGGGGE